MAFNAITVNVKSNVQFDKHRRQQNLKPPDLYMTYQVTACNITMSLNVFLSVQLNQTFGQVNIRAWYFCFLNFLSAPESSAFENVKIFSPFCLNTAATRLGCRGNCNFRV